MFEFAISQHRKRPLSRRFLAAWIVSCVLHIFAVLILIEYPQLLTPGLNPWFRPTELLSGIFPRISSQEKLEPKWRTLAFVGKSSQGKMTAPSAETLQRYMYDWSKHPNAGSAPPVQVRWGSEQRAAMKEAQEQEPKPRSVMGMQEPKQEHVASAAERMAAAGSSEGKAGGEGSGSGNETAQGAGSGGAGSGGAIYLPAPKPLVPSKSAETASNATPTRIPEGISAPSPPPSAAVTKPTVAPQDKSTAKVFESEQQAKISEGSGLFDTKGFPLGDYADLVVARVKGNWMIPSSLRNSQGRTTVIFYIDRDGRFTNARIVTSSGSDSLDLAALNAVIESNPFPPLPKGFPGNHVGAKFVFSYNERQ
jgi:TonB family protein